MSKYLSDYKFEITPLKIEYFDDEPLKLTNNFVFFHNKSTFRKELVRLQNFFQEFLNHSINASGIRDSYLKEKYSKKYLIVLFTDLENVKDSNLIIKENSDKEISLNCFYLISNSNYMLLLAKDRNGLISGIDTMEEILTQTFNDYIKQKQYDDYVKIRPFKLLSCAKSPDE